MKVLQSLQIGIVCDKGSGLGKWVDSIELYGYVSLNLFLTT